jgi:hypothetical protein
MRYVEAVIALGVARLAQNKNHIIFFSVFFPQFKAEAEFCSQFCFVNIGCHNICFWLKVRRDKLLCPGRIRSAPGPGGNRVATQYVFHTSFGCAG